MEGLCSRFGSISYDNFNVTQEGLVREYRMEFERLANRVKWP